MITCPAKPIQITLASIRRYMRFTAPLPVVIVLLILTLPVWGQDPHNHGESALPIKCGTPVWIAGHAPGASDKDKQLLSQLRCDSREVKQRNYLTEAGHFRIHYDVSGRDSVSIRDANLNDVPDYIDSVAFYLEMAWDVEIGMFGYTPPPSDNAGPGPEVDVLVCDLSGAYYGYAIPEYDRPTGPNTVSGFLVLDNDYRGYPTPGIPGLRVTSAHEFHHIVQFSAYRNDLSQASIYEATSVWFERKVHPSINDFRQYSDSLILFPQNYGFSTNATQTTVTGYAHVLYLDYLEKKYGRDVIRRAWEEFRTKPTEWEAWDAALISRGGNLATSYCEFSEWTYRTGDRADSAYLPDAADYPTMRAVVTLPFDGDAISIPSNLLPLSFGLYRIALPRSASILRDTVDVLVTNARTDFGKGTPALPKDRFAITISRDDGPDMKPLRGQGDSVFYRIDDAGGVSCSKVVVDGRPVVFIASHPSPQPFVIDGAERLVVPVPDNGEPVVSASLWIYTSSMRPVADVQQSGLAGANNLVGVVWDGRNRAGELVGSGVYVYELEINGSTYSVGKIAVVRK